ARIVGGEHVGGGPFGAWLLDGAFGFEVEVAQEQLVVAGEVVERGEHAGLFVIVVVALRPLRLGERRILLVPRACVLIGAQGALFGVGAGVAERFIEAADAVVHGGNEHQVTGGPGVEGAVGEDAGHAEFGDFGNIVPAHHLPFVGQDGVDPGVVGAIAHGAVVEIGHGFVQVVKHLRLESDEGIEDVAGELQGEAHGVAVVIVGDGVSPIDQGRELFAGVLAVPAIDVPGAVAAVHFDHGSNQRDHVIADGLDIGALVHGQALGELHEGGGCAGFRGMDGAGDVIDGRGGGDQLIGLGVVKLDGARVGEFGEAGAVFVEPGEQGLRGDGHGDHFAAFLGLADAEDLDARGGFLQQAHVAIDVGRVGQDAGRSGDIAQHRLRSGNGLGGGQVIGKGRVEERLGGVLANLPGVLFVHRLGGVAAGLLEERRTRLGEEGKREQRGTETPENRHLGDYNLLARDDAGKLSELRSDAQGTGCRSKVKWFVAGAIVLFSYGYTVNTPKWDFGRLLGVYVTLFFLVAQLIGWIFFHESPSRAVIAGGALILAGGTVITYWRGVELVVSASAALAAIKLRYRKLTPKGEAEPLLPLLQAQAVGDNGDAGEGHNGRRQHGREQTQRRHGNTDDVVGEGPEEILADDAHGAARKLQRFRHAVEIVAHEGHAAGFHGDIGAAAHGDSEIGLCQGGRIVDAIAHHGHAASGGLQFADFSD